MGGPGSGGYKNAPGDIETHTAWEIIAADPDSQQKLAQVRCKYCGKEMAQHTSRQRVHLLSCDKYLDAMKESGLETSITKQAADPTAFFKSSKSLLGLSDTKPPKILKIGDHTLAVRIQALSLAEAHVSAERVYDVTGIDPKTLAGLRKLARERGYDPSLSLQMKEEYVMDPPNMNRPRGRPKKHRPDDDDLDPALDSPNQQHPVPQSQRAPPGFMQADQLPPGNWNFMAPQGGHTY